MTDSMISRDDVVRVQRGWARVASGGPAVWTIFYHRMFEIAPATRGLFADDIEAQSAKLMQTLNWIVDHLHDQASLLPQAAGLAVRHVRYGVSADHYPVVGAALVTTLSDALGSAFTQADREAWERVYGTLSAAMIAAAYGSPASTADQ
jgi:nitric oxide dioxygenase